MERVEVITRVERRRKWSEAEKATVLAETDMPGASVATIARKHGIAKSVLYGRLAVYPPRAGGCGHAGSWAGGVHPHGHDRRHRG
jgi:hypothetical protein